MVTLWNCSSISVLEVVELAQLREELGSGGTAWVFSAAALLT